MRTMLYPAAVILLAAVLLGGCSSPNDGNTSTSMSASEKFELVEQDIDMFVQSFTEFVAQDLNSFQSFDPATVSPRPLGKATVVTDSVITYDTSYVNGWHIITATGTSENESVSVSDSLRFVDLTGTPQQDPNPVTTDAIYLRQHVNLSLVIPDMGMSISMEVDGGFDFTGFQSSTIIADGYTDMTMAMAFQTEYGPTTMNMTYDLDINDIAVSNPTEGGTGCITGGSFVIEFVADVDGYDENGQRIDERVRAYITLTFNGSSGVYVTTIDGSNFTQTFDGCDLE